MKQNKRKGFTLLEIIIVIIIIGVLAALALPRFFSMVEYSKSAEALNAFTTIRGSMERCSSANNGLYLGCNLNTGTQGTNLDIVDPSTSTNTHFGYRVAGQDVRQGYTITAVRNTVDNGTQGDLITLTVDGAAGTITKTGTGAFINIR